MEILVGGEGEFHAIIVNEYSISIFKNEMCHTNLLFKPISKVLKKGICGPEKLVRLK